jgi:hypothetical protein
MRWLFAGAPVLSFLAACAPVTSSTSAAQVCPRCLPQNEASWRPVQDQLEAYNAHDIERFLRPYADDVVLLEEPEGKAFVHGKTEMRAEYEKTFTTYKPVVDVRQRIVSGEWIFDQEFTSKGHDSVAAYHVKGGRIVEVRFFPVNPS